MRLPSPLPPPPLTPTRIHPGTTSVLNPRAPPTVLRYGLMRLSTHGTGDLNRLSDEQRAAGQLRGQQVMQESRDHSAELYSIFEAVRASPNMVITCEIVFSLVAIGRQEPLRRVFTLAGVECSNRAAFEAGEFCAVLGELWYITNQNVGRTEEEVLADQARARPLPLPRCPAAPAAPSCTRLTDRRRVCAAAKCPHEHVRLQVRDDHGAALCAARGRCVAGGLASRHA